MSIKEVRIALETALGGITPSLATASQNVRFSPVIGTPWQRVDLMSAEPENPTIGDDFYREIGYMQVTLFYPHETGLELMMDRVELIRSTFKRGATFVSGTVETTIERTPEIAPSFFDKDTGFFGVVIKIRYFANIPT